MRLLRTIIIFSFVAFVDSSLCFILPLLELGSFAALLLLLGSGLDTKETNLKPGQRHNCHKNQNLFLSWRSFELCFQSKALHKKYEKCLAQNNQLSLMNFTSKLTFEKGYLFSTKRQKKADFCTLKNMRNGCKQSIVSLNFIPKLTFQRQPFFVTFVTNLNQAFL